MTPDELKQFDLWTNFHLCNCGQWIDGYKVNQKHPDYPHAIAIGRCEDCQITYAQYITHLDNYYEPDIRFPSRPAYYGEVAIPNTFLPQP